MKMSPFMHADIIKKPIAHPRRRGHKQRNQRYPVGTILRCVEGNGADARLVLLPHESHSTRAFESVCHTLAETSEFFDKHLSAKAVEREADVAQEQTLTSKL